MIIVNIETEYFYRAFVTIGIATLNYLICFLYLWLDYSIKDSVSYLQNQNELFPWIQYGPRYSRMD